MRSLWDMQHDRYGENRRNGDLLTLMLGVQILTLGVLVYLVVR